MSRPPDLKDVIKLDVTCLLFTDETQQCTQECLMIIHIHCVYEYTEKYKTAFVEQRTVPNYNNITLSGRTTGHLLEQKWAFLCVCYFTGRFSDIMLWDVKYVETQKRTLSAFFHRMCRWSHITARYLSTQLPWQRSPTGLQGTQAYCLCFLYLDENMIIVEDTVLLCHETGKYTYIYIYIYMRTYV